MEDIFSCYKKSREFENSTIDLTFDQLCSIYATLLATACASIKPECRTAFINIMKSTMDKIGDTVFEDPEDYFSFMEEKFDIVSVEELRGDQEQS